MQRAAAAAAACNAEGDNGVTFCDSDATFIEISRLLLPLSFMSSMPASILWSSFSAFVSTLVDDVDDDGEDGSLGDKDCFFKESDMFETKAVTSLSIHCTVREGDKSCNKSNSCLCRRGTPWFGLVPLIRWNIRRAANENPAHQKIGLLPNQKRCFIL